jgi:hypothetical protein
MAMFSKRPPSLAHLSDEAAARALSRHFGNMVEAAKDLGVDRKDFRRLTWSNPAILDAAHEQMELFAMVRRDELISGLASKVWDVRRRAADVISTNSVLFDPYSRHDLTKYAPASRPRTRAPNPAAAAERARLALERQASAERTLEREREAAMEMEREQRREVVEFPVVASPPQREVAPRASSTSLWPAHVRRPTPGTALVALVSARTVMRYCSRWCLRMHFLSRLTVTFNNPAAALRSPFAR